MLTELHIENLGVIERASLVFSTGMTALTGETGAGKTMLVEAIELLVGGRADAAIVRRGAKEARVDGRLLVPRHDGSGAADEVVLSRVVPLDGRSRAYVNGRPATVTQSRGHRSPASSTCTANMRIKACCPQQRSAPHSIGTERSTWAHFGPLGRR